MLQYEGAEVILEGGKSYVRIPLDENPSIKYKEGSGCFFNLKLSPVDNDRYGNSHRITGYGKKEIMESYTDKAERYKKFPILGNAKTYSNDNRYSAPYRPQEGGFNGAPYGGGQQAYAPRQEPQRQAQPVSFQSSQGDDLPW